MNTDRVRLIRTPVMEAPAEVEARAAEETARLTIALDNAERLTWEMSVDGPAEVDAVEELSREEVIP